MYIIVFHGEMCVSDKILNCYYLSTNSTNYDLCYSTQFQLFIQLIQLFVKHFVRIRFFLNIKMFATSCWLHHFIMEFWNYALPVNWQISHLWDTICNMTLEWRKRFTFTQQRSIEKHKSAVKCILEKNKNHIYFIFNGIFILNNFINA